MEHSTSSTFDNFLATQEVPVICGTRISCLFLQKPLPSSVRSNSESDESTLNCSTVLIHSKLPRCIYPTSILISLLHLLWLSQFWVFRSANSKSVRLSMCPSFAALLIRRPPAVCSFRNLKGCEGTHLNIAVSVTSGKATILSLFWYNSMMARFEAGAPWTWQWRLFRYPRFSYKTLSHSVSRPREKTKQARNYDTKINSSISFWYSHCLKIK
jgi:hypothetical protein